MPSEHVENEELDKDKEELKSAFQRTQPRNSKMNLTCGRDEKLNMLHSLKMNTRVQMIKAEDVTQLAKDKPSRVKVTKIRVTDL